MKKIQYRAVIGKGSDTLTPKSRRRCQGLPDYSETPLLNPASPKDHVIKSINSCILIPIGKGFFKMFCIKLFGWVFSIQIEIQIQIASTFGPFGAKKVLLFCIQLELELKIVPCKLLIMLCYPALPVNLDKIFTSLQVSSLQG